MAEPCTFGTCGQRARPYAEGPRCDRHAPWARAGRPDPGSGRYCLAICYCKGQCRGQRPAPLAPITATVLDLDAIRTGKRRARSEQEYRAAQAQPRRR